MNEPISAQKSPYKVVLEEGQKYAFCKCGLSKKQPYCDGAHKEAGELKPKVFVAEKSGEMFLCGCKRTGAAPYCDGTHKTI
jgi:CDGSH-type Zn-finger protein